MNQHTNHVAHVVALYALLILTAPLVWATGTASASAQTFVCPPGYTCTPISSAPKTYGNGYYYPSGGYTNVSAPTSPATIPAGSATALPLPRIGTGCYAFNVDLTVGNRGQDVSALQSFLSSKGYSMPVTGYFGSVTASNLARYQSANGISEDGYFGPSTRAKVNVDCGSPSTGTMPGSTSYSSIPSIQAVYQGMNASGPAYNFVATISNPSVVYVRITLSCPAGVGAVMKVSGDCNDDGGLIGINPNAPGIFSWNGLLLNHTSSYQTVTVTATALTSALGVIGSAQTQISIPVSPDWQPSMLPTIGGSISVSYPTAGMVFSAGNPISVAFMNPVLGTTYTIQLRGKAYAATLGTTYVGMATDQQKATFLVPTDVPADAAPFNIVIMNGSTDIAYSQSISVTAFSGTKGVAPSAGPLSASCSGVTDGKDSYDLVWTGSVSGGTAPYSYAWSAYNDVSAYIGGNTQSTTFAAKYSTSGSKQAVMRVFDSAGSSVNATCSGSIPATTVAPQPPAPVPVTASGPSTVLLISLKSVKPGEVVTLLSNTVSPSASLQSAAIDLSMDNASWISGAPCGYWNSPTGSDSAHAITCNYTPSAAGTYYFRSRGTDKTGASAFVYQTLVVSP